MVYQYKETEDTLDVIKFRFAGTWKYIPLKTFHRTGKDSECMIFGDVTGAPADSAIKYVYNQHNNEKNTLRLFRYRNRLSIFDKIIGFIPVSNSSGKDGYVRIRRKSYKKIVIALLTALTVIAACCIALGYKRTSNLDENAIAYQLPNGVKNTDPDAIMLPGHDVLTMNFATQKVTAALLNPEGNTCYFKFTIVMKEDGTKLYQTGLIKPGMAVTSFKIDRELKKGRYPIVLKVDALDLKDTKNSYNGGAVEAILEVK